MAYTKRNESGSIALCEDDVVLSCLQNIAMIVSTRKGTVPMYRSFGLRGAFIDRPMPVAQTIMAAEVREAIEDFEPRATFVDISFSHSVESPDRITATIKVRIGAEDAVLTVELGDTGNIVKVNI